IRRRDAFEPADYLMLSATARVHIHCDGRPLNRIVPPAVTRARPSPDDRLLPMPPDRRAPYVPPVSPVPSAATDVAELANGYGELDADGNYRIRIAGDRLPPAPWSNVIANE